MTVAALYASDRTELRRGATLANAVRDGMLSPVLPVEYWRALHGEAGDALHRVASARAAEFQRGSD